MNANFKTSGGNIIAIVVLLFIGYTTFLQLSNKVGNNLGSAFLLATFIVACTTLLFGGLQLLKNTTKDFKKRIRIEKIVLIISPILFLIMMQPFIQFWNVQKDADIIEQTYEKAIGYTIRIFDEYDKYANQRIQKYDAMLKRIIHNKNVRPKEYHACGFTGSNDKVKRENKVMMLRTQLIAGNYKNLRESAVKWSDAKHKASVWNFFMQNNLSELNQAITDWHKELVSLSEKVLSDEEFNHYNEVEAFDAHDDLLKTIQTELGSISSNYLQQDEQSVQGYLFSLVAYILLLIPYLVQQRDPKSIYHLFYTEKVNNGINLDTDHSMEEQMYNSNKHERFSIVIDNEKEEKGENIKDVNDEDIKIDMSYGMKTETLRKKRKYRNTSEKRNDEGHKNSSFTL